MESEVMPCFLWHSRLLAPARRWDSYLLRLVCKLETYSLSVLPLFPMSHLVSHQSTGPELLGLAYS